MKEQNFKFRKSFGKLIEQMTDKQAEIGRAHV